MPEDGVAGIELRAMRRQLSAQLTRDFFMHASFVELVLDDRAPLRSRHKLKAPVGFGGGIDGNPEIETVVHFLGPEADILVPGRRAAGFGELEKDGVVDDDEIVAEEMLHDFE